MYDIKPSLSKPSFGMNYRVSNGDFFGKIDSQITNFDNEKVKVDQKQFLAKRYQRKEV